MCFELTLFPRWLHVGIVFYLLAANTALEKQDNKTKTIWSLQPVRKTKYSHCVCSYDLKIVQKFKDGSLSKDSTSRFLSRDRIRLVVDAS